MRFMDFGRVAQALHSSMSESQEEFLTEIVNEYEKFKKRLDKEKEIWYNIIIKEGYYEDRKFKWK